MLGSFCTNCGKPLKPGSRFCAECGTPVRVNAGITEQAKPQPQQPTQPSQPRPLQPQQPPQYAQAVQQQPPQYVQPPQPQQPPLPPQYAQPPQPQYGQQPYGQPVKSDNRKLYSILSYIGILWLVGMFASPEKDDPRVRFHVGQGIILSIAYVALDIVVAIVAGIFSAIGTHRETFLGVTYTVSKAGWVVFLTGLLWWAAGIFFLVFAIMGIMNVTNNRDQQLPVIGKFAFYK